MWDFTTSSAVHHTSCESAQGLFSHPVKVKQSLYRPGQALVVPGGCDSQISRQSAHEGGKVVSPLHQPPVPTQEIFLVLISVEAELTPGSYCGQKD